MTVPCYERGIVITHRYELIEQAVPFKNKLGLYQMQGAFMGVKPVAEVEPVAKFQVRLSIGVFVLIVGFAFIVAFFYFRDYQEQLKFSAAVVGAMAAIFSAYYVAESMRIKLICDQQVAERETVKAALRFSFTDDPYLSLIIQRLGKHLRIHTRDHAEIPLEELHRFPNDGYPEFNSDITYILGRLEVMCISIKRGIASEDACIDLLLSRTVLYYDLFKQHIKEKQRTIGKDIYENFEETAVRWQDVRNKLYSNKTV